MSALLGRLPAAQPGQQHARDLVVALETVKST